MNHERSITKLFNFFYSKFYKGSSYKLDLSINGQKKFVDSFIKALSVYFPSLEAIGSAFLVDYFAFAFEHYSKKKLARNITLNWIIGKKMVQRYFERNTNHSEHFVNNFLVEYDIDLNQIRSVLHEDDVINKKLDPAEELEKLRFTGDARLYHCLHNTTLFNHRSINCLGCDNRIVCKGLLKKVNLTLFTKRGYN